MTTHFHGYKLLHKLLRWGKEERRFDQARRDDDGEWLHRGPYQSLRVWKTGEGLWTAEIQEPVPFRMRGQCQNQQQALDLLALELLAAIGLSGEGA